MPAYRSSAEAEVRDAVVARLRQFRPEARIMHEVNAASFGNRIDVLAVDRAEIIVVEVKSEKDKLDRLPSQIEAMQGVAHHVVLALHEKFFKVDPGDGIVRHRYRRLPDPMHKAAQKAGAAIWAFPRDAEGLPSWETCWADPRRAVTTCLPPAALGMLWAEELRQLCASLGIKAGSRATMPFCINALRWSCTGEQITKGICAALRARRCIEADPAIEVAA